MNLDNKILFRQWFQNLMGFPPEVSMDASRVISERSLTKREIFLEDNSRWLTFWVE